MNKKELPTDISNALKEWTNAPILHWWECDFSYLITCGQWDTDDNYIIMFLRLWRGNGRVYLSQDNHVEIPNEVKG